MTLSEFVLVATAFYTLGKIRVAEAAREPNIVTCGYCGKSWKGYAITSPPPSHSQLCPGKKEEV